MEWTYIFNVGAFLNNPTSITTPPEKFIPKKPIVETTFLPNILSNTELQGPQTINEEIVSNISKPDIFQKKKKEQTLSTKHYPHPN